MKNTNVMTAKQMQLRATAARFNRMTTEERTQFARALATKRWEKERIAKDSSSGRKKSQPDF